MALLSGNFLTENNQSVETNIGGWTAGALSSAIVQSTDQAHSGTHSIKCTRNAVAAPNSLADLTTFGNFVFVKPGQVVTPTFWIFTATTSSYNLGIDWYTANNATYVSTSTGTTSAATVNTWTQIGVGDTFTVPATAYIGRIFIQNTSGLANGNTCYIDDVFVGAATTSPMTLTTTSAWTAPAGTTSVQVECWGAGGAGGSATTTNCAGGGGAGGAYAKNTSIAVTAGVQYVVTVGLGGFAATPSGNTAAVSGDDTWFSTTGTVLAKGGAGGGDRSTAGNGTAGTGTTTGSIGGTTFAGGNGAIGASATNGGGGGGGPGDAAVGGNASGITAGTGGSAGGGAGGAGISGTVGGHGLTPGGAGGGARANSATVRLGGDGGNGQVLLTWTSGPTLVSDSDTSAGTESQSIAATLSGSETSSGTETQSLDLADTETSLGTESQTIAATLSDTETGAGTETQSISLSDTDTSNGVDSESVLQAALGSETNAGVDTESIAATLSDNETGIGTETFSLLVTLSDSDTVLGTDIESAGGTPSDTEGSGSSESQSIQILRAPVDERSLVMGPANLYISSFGALEPSNGLVATAPDSGVWSDLGGLLGGVELTVEQEWFEVELKQIPDKPMRRLKKRRLSIKTQLAEPTLANLGYALNDTPAVSGTLYEPSNRSEASILSYNALIVDGWKPGFSLGGHHKRRRLIIRKCLSIDNVELTYSKDGQSVYTVTWTCHYVDSTTPIFRVIDEA